jgi:hypothetical protein
MNEKIFFEELKKLYEKENQNFPWNWEEIQSKDENVSRDFIFFIAYNLSKNILHGPLPNKIHTRMMLETENKWSKKYSEYMLGKWS